MEFMNNWECGKCTHLDGRICKKKNIEVDSDEIVEDCNDFNLSIYDVI